MMDCCEFFDTEEEAIAACNYAVVDLETAKDLLDFGGKSQLPCLVVTV